MLYRNICGNLPKRDNQVPLFSVAIKVRAEQITLA